MPERQQVVISNTTPIIALSLIEQLHLLADLYGEVLVPTAVFDEVIVGGVSKIGVTDFRRSDWLRVVELADPSRANLLADLDRGEAETIALAQEVNADLVIIDERLGRRYARHLGLTMTGTLGVLIKAKQLGHISDVGALIEELQRGGIRLGDDVIRRALELAGELD